MLLIALAALVLSGGIAIWEWVELGRRARSPWWNTQQATARARARARWAAPAMKGRGRTELPPPDATDPAR